jgi:hypothetical protein
VLSSEQMLKNRLKAGGYLNHVDLVRTVAEHANEALDGSKTCWALSSRVSTSTAGTR